MSSNQQTLIEALQKNFRAEMESAATYRALADREKDAHRADVIRRMAQGSLERANDLLEQTMGGKELNTAFIERFNGTMRERLASLTRRCRHAVRRVGMRRPLGCGSLDVPTTFAGRTMS